MADFPALNYVSDTLRTKTEMKASLEAWIAACRELPGGAEGGLTVASGVITLVQSGIFKPILYVDPETSTTDTIIAINTTGVDHGRFFILYAGDGNTITVRDDGASAGRPNLRPFGTVKEYVLEDRGASWLMFVVGGDGECYEVARGENPHNSVLITGSGSFATPDGIFRVNVFAVGGGGGGGGGAGGSLLISGNPNDGADGGNGGNGGNTVVSRSSTPILTANGGALGGYGLASGGYKQNADGNSGCAGMYPQGYGGLGGSRCRSQFPQTGYGDGGAGGKGGNLPNAPSFGAGGGASGIPGSVEFAQLDVTPRETLTVTIGAGGTAGAAGAGGTGGASYNGGVGTAGNGGAVLIIW